jgi:hypothetical protein
VSGVPAPPTFSLQWEEVDSCVCELDWRVLDLWCSVLCVLRARGFLLGLIGEASVNVSEWVVGEESAGICLPCVGLYRIYGGEACYTRTVPALKIRGGGR